MCTNPDLVQSNVQLQPRMSPHATSKKPSGMAAGLDADSSGAREERALVAKRVAGAAAVVKKTISSQNVAAKLM